MAPKLMTALILSASLAGPLTAQDWEMPRAEDQPPASADGAERPGDDPLSGLEQELNRTMDGIFRRLQPHLEGLGNELAGTVNEFSPALRELSALIDDFGNYHRPERLENGDIVIRRRADAPPPPDMDELQRLLPDEGDGAPGRGEEWAPPENSTPVPQTEL
ncbi:hypothetical protein SAMN05421538_10921 [Paracoccus isoporae]|uniref:AAA+ family ATPase n=1 Tax=Paracoccus isoporae TaxID=591205 RepID=A0A1G7EM81_9RHOB|nr:hypothetical protein [Paracoccus isoporae]SDE64744.1 hypothetical protein SAMN05421538_10921 [Paracoccus isoporae]